ncbi:hypothetical protein CBR_g3232 [Chara braunii]|uniref:carbonic anhydrase n=1 Tax=Chara braunii TaxID=69332 RepID=A0A388KF63_CHABU|nr:hypothetical protein CBR_g3232 [Chara braunii]|eukprot:GBG68690.1 hypothetical protein CBR_g3232 [Chara braunii]
MTCNLGPKCNRPLLRSRSMIDTTFWLSRRKAIRTTVTDLMERVLPYLSSSSSSSPSSSSSFSSSFSSSSFSFRGSGCSSYTTSSSSCMSRNFLAVCLVLLLTSLLHPAHSAMPSSTFSAKRAFSYMKNGQDWPDVCTGPRTRFQSPINIVEDNVIPVHRLGDLRKRATYSTFTGDVSVRHDGFTFSILFPGNNIIRLPQFRLSKSFNGSANWDWETAHYGPAEGYQDLDRHDDDTWKPRSKTFKLVECHFHSVSETELNGMHMDLEMHCVHLRRGYPTVGVWGVFFNRTGSKNSISDESNCNPLLDKIIPALGQLASSPPMHPVSVDVGTFSLAHLFPQDGTYFHFYPGSLTTPPCTEGLLWYVFKEALPVCKRQVRQFQRFVTKLSGIPALNYRDVQPLNGRTVFSWEDGKNRRRG